MPDNPVVLCDLGLELKETGNTAEAIPVLRRALALKPDFERAKYALGIALQMNGESTEASAEMREIRQLHQSRAQLVQSKKLISDGVELFKQQKWQAALEQFQASAAMTPALPASYYYVAQAETRLDEPQKAIEAYKKAIELKPDYAEAHMALGILYARMEDYAPAMQQLHEAVLSDGDLADAHYNFALVLERAGKTEEAKREASDALALDPNNTDYRMLLASIDRPAQ